MTKLSDKQAELEREIEENYKRKLQKVYDHNGKEKYTQRDYKRIYQLKAELKGLQEGAKQQKEDELEFLKELDIVVLERVRNRLIKERIKHLEMKE